MGVVIEATDLELRRPVAIKLVHPGFTSSESFVRFEREARVLGSFSSPRVVRVFDAGMSGGQPFIVMERLDGAPLSRLMAQGAFAESLACEMLAAILEGLVVLHDARVLHRDLKPSNVFVSRATGPVLIDFGLARGTTSTAITEKGVLLGTPRYLAPELFLGHENSPGSDVFALGLIASEMLLGTADQEVGQQGVERFISNLTSGAYFETLIRELEGRGSLSAVILGAVHPDVSIRFPDAGRMAEALRRATAGAPEPRPRSTPVAREDRTRRLPVPEMPVKSRGSRSLALSAGILVVVLVGLVGWLAPSRPGVPAGVLCASSPPTVRPSVARPRALTQDTLRRLEEWHRRTPLRELCNRYQKGSAIPEKVPEIASQIRSLLSTSGLDDLHDEPAPLLESSATKLDQKVYWELMWRHGVERSLEPEALGGYAVLRVLPEHLRPGAARPAQGRAFVLLPERGELPTAIPADAGLQAVLSEMPVDALRKKTRWTLPLADVSRARRAWIGLAAGTATFRRFVRLTINDRLSIALMVDRRSGATQLMTHTIPTWALRNGSNVFEASLDSFSSIKLNEHLAPIESFTVVLEP